MLLSLNFQVNDFYYSLDYLSANTASAGQIQSLVISPSRKPAGILGRRRTQNLGRNASIAMVNI
jgi:hypothetical protein